MKKIKSVVFLFGILSAAIGQAFCQNALLFTGVTATPENAIQLSWASNSNEVYEVDYADSLIDPNTGTTTWLPLYTDYPSQGTTTFITDCGNYDLSPEIPHPALSPMRFYLVTLLQANDSPTNPSVALISPNNGAGLSGLVTVQVAASSPEILCGVKLYIDGEEQWPSDDGSNFVVNTCEWLNGGHMLYATAKSESGFEGVANGGIITCGRSVSPFVNVTFSNLISEFSFSQPYFEPALGETQEVTADFAENCNWTLQIQDVHSNTVLAATGSGNSMTYNWDGMGNGETNIPDGVYSYLLSAQPNGESSDIVSDSLDGVGGESQTSSAIASASLTSLDSPELWAVGTNHSGYSMPLPLAIYPPGCDITGLTVFEATSSEIESLRTLLPHHTRSRHSHAQLLAANVSGGGVIADGSGSGSGGTSGQSTSGPQRKPRTGVKGAVGTFGICYKTYGTNGFSSPHPATGWPYPLPALLALDGQSRTAQTKDRPIQEFAVVASDFAATMKKAAWKPQFIKANDQWGATDLKKPSQGGNSIFNTCNFGLLMTHGSYNSGSAGADFIKHSYVWMGGANSYVSLSDMDFGSDSPGGLRWMTIFACETLQIDCVGSMIDNSAFPANANLHLLMGCATVAYASTLMGTLYASNLVANVDIPDAWYNCAHQAYHLNHNGITNSVVFRVVGNGNCFHDTLATYNDPDPNQTGSMDDELVFDLSNP
jgi:hypothetical protein